MSKQPHPPSISETAFECPHCGAYTTQFWTKLYADNLGRGKKPHRMTEEEFDESLQDTKVGKDRKLKLKKFSLKMLSGLTFFDAPSDSYIYIEYHVHNLNLSQCYECNKIAIWQYNNLIFPSDKPGVLPNEDLDDDIIRDFEEARDILNKSPRGAAALLRLCIQKLCIQLDEKGENLNDDIASLVSKGLNQTIQKSLDIVRVVGNEAVHPGVLDLRDDTGTAEKLLTLINSIADQMISHPKQVDDFYEQLPADKREAIEKRDKKTNSKDP